jgi:hypothetical protein
MNRETITIITPVSKHTVVLNTYLTGREKRQLTNIFLQGNLQFNTESKNVTGLNYELIDREQDTVWGLVVVSINGNTQGIVDAILDMRAEDYDFVVAEVNKVRNDTKFEEKKTV